MRVRTSPLPPSFPPTPPSFSSYPLPQIQAPISRTLSPPHAPVTLPHIRQRLETPLLRRQLWALFAHQIGPASSLGLTGPPSPSIDPSLGPIALRTAVGFAIAARSCQLPPLVGALIRRARAMAALFASLPSSDSIAGFLLLAFFYAGADASVGARYFQTAASLRSRVGEVGVEIDHAFRALGYLFCGAAHSADMVAEISAKLAFFGPPPQFHHLPPLSTLVVVRLLEMRAQATLTSSATFCAFVKAALFDGAGIPPVEDLRDRGGGVFDDLNAADALLGGVAHLVEAPQVVVLRFFAAAQRAALHAALGQRAIAAEVGGAALLDLLRSGRVQFLPPFLADPLEFTGKLALVGGDAALATLGEVTRILAGVYPSCRALNDAVEAEGAKRRDFVEGVFRIDVDVDDRPDC